MRAEVLTPWIGSGAEHDGYRPKVGDEYTLQSWKDTTGQPAENLSPDPNMYIVQIEADPAVIAAIDADPNYQVLWNE